MMISKRIRNMDDWVDLFEEWKKDVGVELPKQASYTFDAYYDSDDTTGKDIEFGDFSGKHKWNTVMDVPTQNIRDTLLQLVYVQADTEFASVEQQRLLVEKAPHDYDLYALVRIMLEEMRHGWQMCDILVKHFGSSGKLEAQKLLERRASEAFPESKGGKRLLGSFNQAVNNWLDFYTYTCFVDRDGKYQLGMLAPSAFAPLARSAGPMLREEAFHLGTGQDGLKRIVLAGQIPVAVIQRYFNKWISTAHDLFGKDESSTAEWGYVWGLKGRFDERSQENKKNFNRKELNHHNRMLYHQEISDVVHKLNKHLEEEGREERLFVPDLKFRRAIGRYADEYYDAQGNSIDTEESYQNYLKANLPSKEDEDLIKDLAKDSDYILKRQLPENAWQIRPPVIR